MTAIAPSHDFAPAAWRCGVARFLAITFAITLGIEATGTFFPGWFVTPGGTDFSEYRQHGDLSLPFAGEVAKEIEGKDVTYWQGHLDSWQTQTTRQ